MPQIDNHIDRFADDLLALVVPIDSVKYDPLNARLHPEKNIEAVKKSLVEFGQVKPIVVRRANRTVVAGNGTLEAARALGWTKIAATFADFSEAAAAAYGLTDNRTAELAKWDANTVAKVEAIAKSGGHNIIGWTDDDLRSLYGILMDDGVVGNGNKTQLTPIFDTDAIVDSVFKFLRKNGFPYRHLPIHSCMIALNHLALTKTENLYYTTTGGSVADSYHHHRWHASAADMRSPFDTFSDDNRLRTAIRKEIELGGKVSASGNFGLLSLSEGTQACSNFRPGYALSVYRRYAKGKDSVVLDTSTGYGGRLVGFMASGLAKYIGIDPSTKTVLANSKMASDLGFAKRVELICKPAEDVDPRTIKEKCDVAFTSPPYFGKEIYSDEETQCCHRYKGAIEWRDKFLVPMMRLQYVALRPGSYAVVNIAPIKMKGAVIALDEWTISAAVKCGFTHEGTDRYPMNRRVGSHNDGESTHTEPVLIFRK